MRRNHRRGLLLSSGSTNSLFEPLEQRTLMSAAGALDWSFNGYGTASVSFGGPGYAPAEAVAVQSDGKTVVVGKSSTGDFAVARFNLNGTLDSGFGPDHDGRVLTHIGSASLPGHATGVAIQPNGDLVVVGIAADDTSSDFELAVVRYSPNGSLDSTFGTAGVGTLELGRNLNQSAAVTLQADGKIVVANSESSGDGNLFKGGTYNFAVMRFNTDGSLDHSFGDSGVRYVDFGAEEFASDLAIDYNGTPASNPLYGSIVVVGTQHDYPNPNQLAVARLTPSGDFDNSFGGNAGNGREVLRFAGPVTQGSEASGVVIQSNDDIVVAGSTNNAASGHDFAVIRLLPSGNPDSSFGSSGNGQTVMNLGGDDIARDVIQSYDGELLVGGGIDNKQFAIVKLTADGLPDNAFGVNGVVKTGFKDGDASAFRLAVGPGRRFVAAGGAHFHTARYLDANANLVYATALRSDAYEHGQVPTSFFVYRSERLPYATGVYLSVGGTAASPLYSGLPRFRPSPDYTGISAPPPSNVIYFNTTYVEIPANQTYTVVTITPVDKGRIGGGETAVFTVDSNPNYEVGTPSSVTINIHNNDGAILADTADAYVRDGIYANTNFGSAGDLEVKQNTTGLNRQTYIKFDLSAVAGQSISKVTLSLFGRLTNTNQASVTTSVFGVANTSWGENTITWNNKPPLITAAAAAPLATATITGTTAQRYTLDLTAYVQSQLAAGHTQITLLLDDLSPSDPYVSFASRESGANGPQLTVAFA
jgi:uncharacterized delta-60 repeat protein